MSITENTELKERKRPGRKPMTAEEKAAAAALREEAKAKADNLKPEIFIEYQGNQTDMNTLVEAVRADFRSVKKRTLITNLKMYVKPEENAVYYVVNESYQGKISF